MYLQLEENFPYTFVPLRDGSGMFVHNDKLSEFLSKKHKGGFFKGLKKVGLSVPRNAFLGLVKLNVFGLASKLQKTIDKGKEEKLRKLWHDDFGGNFNKLKTAISQGKKKKALADQFNPLSLEPATTTAVASATPIIIRVLKFIKEHAPEIADTAKTIIEEIPKITGEKLPPDPVDEPDKYDKEETKAGGSKESGFQLSTPVIIGGVALLALLLLKKK